MATNELAGGDFEFELAAEVEAALFFGFAAAVGDEDVWSVPLLAEFMSLEEKRAYTLIPNSFSPFNTFIASMASGITLPPRIKTPSISNAKAYLSVIDDAEFCVDTALRTGDPEAGVASSEDVAESSRCFLASSID